MTMEVEICAARAFLTTTAPLSSQTDADILGREGSDRDVQDIQTDWGDMLKTLYDPKIFEAGKLEGKREGEMNIITSMIREGLNDAFIARVSKMPVEEIRAIRQSK